MRKRDRRQGLAAIEFALLLPVVAFLGLLLVEGGSAMHTYSSLVEASREGARHVLMEGETADVEGLVAALVVDLDPEALSTNVTTDPVAKTVTVEVSYVYQMFGSQNGQRLFGDEEDEPLRFVAQTTMPLP
ncbi:MAG: TadE/TadG family type IV pilus assembly protein [Pseudodesulfovibrio sp.]|jgi:Flp pilus assembly protein TadG|uniref:Pilus assembly protein TadE n=1 Tax=Pseudodesulfovibrio indicus TaxID=1716143 RepID=A0A126QTD9_9BACT|nr:TadE/TadG family type IV pilus assembly protein [Pseudodesulfovibrio indicus]AMK12715.1 pilus assembly protein TadE [Pseudodesulfovibrio indicus]TDT86806.1 TadE-like protein [Pseudodesulfovibrio indicus]